MTLVGACGAGDTRVDPGDLELRDLLGLAPDVASGWDGAQRAAARRVLVDGFHENAEPSNVTLTSTPSLDDRVVRGLAVVDSNRNADGASALGVVRIVVRSADLTANPRAAERAIAAAQGGAVPTTELWLAEQWDTRGWSHLPGRGLDLLSAIAIDAGHDKGPVIVVPAPRLAAIAGYVAAHGDSPARLIVNPIVLAALEPDATEAVTAALLGRAAVDGTSHAKQVAPPTDSTTAPEIAPVAAGNPYSFYGSVSECAYVQRTRCESCLPSGSCTAVTTSSGNDECTALSAAGGRGYFLLCANLALSISSVDRCVANGAAGCPRDTDAASSLAELENNASFIDDAACGNALDSCLAEIYGAPGGQFPGPGPDAGSDPTDPPRNTSIDCNDSCSSNNNNCEASPNCGCEGPSCNNSLSCDSACSSSNDQGGCDGNCDSCSDDSSGGSSGGSCSSDDGGGTGGGCTSDSGGSSGGSCGGDSCGSSSSGGSCGGDSCGGSSGGGCGGSGGSCGGSGGSCGGGGSSGSCNATKRDSSGGIALAISLMWAFMPVPVAAVIRRRSRRKRKEAAAQDEAAAQEVAP